LGSIRLDPKRGVNPALTFCPRCGGETNELLLVGLAEVRRCSKCSGRIVGPPPRDGICPLCHQNGREFKYLRQFDGSRERLPASQPCDKCQVEMKKHREIVEAGGVYWRCSDCKSEGVLRETAELSKEVRKQMKIEPPAPCGVEFSKDTCPVCGPNPVEMQS